MKRFVTTVVVMFVLLIPAFAQRVVSQIAAKVNKAIILASEIKRAENELGAELAETTKLKGPQLQKVIDERSKDVLRDLIDKELILQVASDLGMDANLDVAKQLEQMQIEYNFESLEALEAAMAKQGTNIEDVKDNIRYRNLRAQVIRREVTGKIVITTEELRLYYEAHKQDFDRPPGVSLGMIAVSTDGLTPAETAAKEKTMTDALAALKRGEDFSELAHKISEDHSSSDGGTLPFLERGPDGTYGLASPEMEEAVGKLTKGKFTDVLANPVSHTLIIFKLLDRHDGGILPFEVAQTEIYGRIMDERAEPKIRAYLTRLRAEGYVEVYPGFTDTGAATQAIRASDTAPPKP